MYTNRFNWTSEWDVCMRFPKRSYNRCYNGRFCLLSQMAHILAKVEQQMVLAICQTTSHVQFDGGDLKLIYLGNYISYI